MNAKRRANTDLKRISELVAHYTANMHELEGVLDQLRSHFQYDKELAGHIHSVKWRIKDPSHLRDKLKRKLQESKSGGKPFTYTKENLFTTVTDLVGFRILHLHTKQMEDIDGALKRRLSSAGVYRITEGPVARTWDDETRKYFSRINIATITSEELYTSVHYIIETTTQKKYTCEIQVRTLSEELWGEVNHSINYPVESKSVPCREQIAVLARMTSSCSRLVDAIFRSHDDHIATKRKTRNARPRRRP